jgi:hypothetical protein
MPSHRCPDCALEVKYPGRCKSCGKLRRAFNQSERRKRLQHTEEWKLKKKNSRLQHTKKKHELISKIKCKPCVDCGKQFHPSLMDLDHLPGVQKRFTISKATANGYGTNSLLEEAAKCEVVCCLCHRVRTWNRTHKEQITGIQVN